jgi:hypothetical protein
VEQKKETPECKSGVPNDLENEASASELCNELHLLKRKNRFKALLIESLMQENRKLANRLLWTNILWGLSQIVWLLSLLM